MSAPVHNRWLHRLAWLTAVVALLPISVGAVVTTVGAGMAFADWPTSDGHGMLTYPWLRSTGDQFLEHGHRLAGMLIGVVTLLLTGLAFVVPCRLAVRGVVVAMLLAVIAQGLLGGSRVIRNEQVLALLHGQFAGWVFSLMGLLVAMTGPLWLREAPIANPQRGGAALALAVLTLVLLLVQFLLGGLLRHLGTGLAWLVHPWFALAVLAAAIGQAIMARRTQAPTVKRSGMWVVVLVVAQAGLGLATWGLKYGFPDWGVVAVQQAPLQIVVRSLHTVLAMLTLMASAVMVVRVWRLMPAGGPAIAAGWPAPALMGGAV